VPVIPAFRRLRQGDWTTERKPVSKTNKCKKKKAKGTKKERD
jgi:hypothetical protein